MKPYCTILGLSQDEFVEKRSRFIGAIAPVSTPEQATAFVQERRAAHKEARHTVWAYLLKDGQARYSDDGEPQGTGGPPALEVLRRSGATDLCVAITRYFGGVLLGAGGLTRAYTKGAGLALEAAQLVEVSPCFTLSMEMEYAQYGLLERICPAQQLLVEETIFTDKVTLFGVIRQTEYAALCQAVSDATAATVVVQQLQSSYRALPPRTPQR